MGSQWRPTSRDSLRQSATIIAVRWLVERRQATSRDGSNVPSKQRVAGSNPVGALTWKTLHSGASSSDYSAPAAVFSAATSDGGHGNAVIERKGRLLRLDPAVHDALAKWAADELRSTNAQIESLLRRTLAEEGRLPSRAGDMHRSGGPPRGSPPG